MTKQQAISVKIDDYNYYLLEQEVFASGRKRNRIINDAIRLYIGLQDVRRYIKCTSTHELQANMLRRVLNDNRLYGLEKYIL